MKKRSNKAFALILAAVCGAAALSACGQPQSSAQETTAAQTEAETAAAQTTEAPTQAVDEFVVTARLESWKLGNGSIDQEYFCQQPQLTFNSVDADEVNREIEARCDRIYTALENGEDMSNVSKGAEYKAYLNGKTLSLVFIDRAPNNGYVEYLVYNFDTEGGSRLSDDELIARSGNPADSVRTNLAHSVAEYFDAMVAEMPSNHNMDAAVATAREQTLSDEYLDMAQYYLADRNTLSAAFAYSWIAGSGRYYDLTEVYPHLPQY